jgi:hypothetical protein
MKQKYLAITNAKELKIPEMESDFIERMLPLPDTGKFIPSEYGI